jgi:hypothetical protein
VESLPHETRSMSPTPQLGRAEIPDELDPELAALPAPPRRARTVTVVLLAIATVAALAMAAALRREITYAFAANSPTSLGDLRSVTDVALAANENQPVRAEALLGAVGGIRYERPLHEDTFRAVPVVGRPDLWVELRVPAGQESGRWEPPHLLAGRLARMDAAGLRHRELRSAIELATHEHVPADAWLLADGEDPANARWSIVLALTFLGFALWNASAIVRILRRVS